VLLDNCLKNLLITRYSVFLFHGVALVSASVYAMMAFFSRAESGLPLITFGFICAAAFALSVLVAWVVAVSGRKITFRQVFFWCVVIRVIAVFGEPIYEDDYYRYLWDGRQTVETGSPYASAPADAFGSEEDPLWSDVLDNINYPNLPTLYGPVNQYVFALAYLIAPGEVLALQIISACADLLVIILLANMASLAAIVLYAFSPLIVKEFAMTAHTDVVAAAAMLLALSAWRREKLLLVALYLAVAVASKLFVLLLVPLLLRLAWRYWLVFFSTLAALYLPILGGDGPLTALSAMAQYWLFNAPLYYLLQPAIDFPGLKLLLLMLFVSGFAAYFHRAKYWLDTPPKIPRGDLVFFGMLLAMPVFNPWYYVFVLCFAAIYPTLWAWAGSLLVLLAYVSGLNLPGSDLDLYEQPAWVLWVEFVPLLLLFVFSTLWKGRFPLR